MDNKTDLFAPGGDGWGFEELINDLRYAAAAMLDCACAEDGVVDTTTMLHFARFSLALADKLETVWDRCRCASLREQPDRRRADRRMSVVPIKETNPRSAVALWLAILLPLAACTSDADRCLEYGFKPGTDAWSTCRMQLDLD
jgi:hypothetical protein